MTPNEKLAYRQLDMQSDDPMEIVAKAFLLAAESCDEARAACERGDIALKGALVNRISTALTLLKADVDHERGGEVAASMDRTYAVLLGRLVTAHATSDVKIFEEVAGHLRSLGSAWDEAARTHRSTTAVRSAPAEGRASLDVRR
ncbi:MAG TPA: flagellar export chaperone FliS [Verrucomicrobiae bacterium]|nr:flagellar export chaperone FliS [Verrucomicrobiae bacterium]